MTTTMLTFQQFCGYQIPAAHERGLNLADVLDMVARSRKWRELATGPKSAVN